MIPARQKASPQKPHKKKAPPRASFLDFRPCYDVKIASTHRTLKNFDFFAFQVVQNSHFVGHIFNCYGHFFRIPGPAIVYNTIMHSGFDPFCRLRCCHDLIFHFVISSLCYKAGPAPAGFLLFKPPQLPRGSRWKMYASLRRQ